MFYIDSYCSGDSNSYRFSSKKHTIQDQLVLDEKAHYIKYYNNNKTLIWEGLKHYYGELIGPIKYYRNDGTLERIENYNHFEYIINGKTYYSGDGAAPVGVWKFYDNSENLIRTHEYTFKINIEIDFTYHVKVIKTYDLKGNVIKEEDEIL
jgi:hypothetical protein